MITCLGLFQYNVFHQTKTKQFSGKTNLNDTLQYNAKKYHTSNQNLINKLLNKRG